MSDLHGDLALLFPGQGVDASETRESVRELRPDLYATATEVCGADPFAHLSEGTNFAQPAIYCASLTIYERMGRPAADIHAGHSLGEITALAAAGAVDSLDGLRIVAERGRLMQEAGEAAGAGGMLAVGSDRDAAVELAGRTGLVVANFNSPSQFVLSGSEDAIERALADARSERGLRVKRLPVTGAFHSPALEPAVQPFRAILDSTEFHPAAVPVYSCVTAEPFGDDPRAALAESITSPVRWIEVMRAMHAAGARGFADVGPGKVLARLVKRILDDETVESVDPARLQHV
jgi:malonyl CoA-acyl carrier protein transacylase